MAGMIEQELIEKFTDLMMHHMEGREGPPELLPPFDVMKICHWVEPEELSREAKKAFVKISYQFDFHQKMEVCKKYMAGGTSPPDQNIKVTFTAAHKAGYTIEQATEIFSQELTDFMASDPEAIHKWLDDVRIVRLPQDWTIKFLNRGVDVHA